MAWYPGATRMELQPESDSQPAIRPTQFILHSIAAPWTARRMYEYWRDSTNLDSTFGLGYAGDLGQYLGTETRADANYLANRRPDGTGAVSIETASNLQHTDPWTDEQVEALINLGVWLHRQHGIPLRICRTWDDPGYGYHGLHPEWAVSGTACPGAARVKQFREIVFPGIVARANGTEEDMPLSDEDVTKVVSAVWNRTEPNPVEGGSPIRTGAVMRYMDYVHGRQNAAIAALAAKVDQLPQPTLTPADITAIAAQVAAHPTLAEQIAELVADKLAARLAD
ncbi:N-acetylmuramoyl-L-alanine amidase [Streptomyces sp. NPDC059534]|uniref:peptidoglycan recognition protein family protein n=1 Tax=Streptomyces sp. NPDC059534 TaxID=3346859 RepID=UPI003683D35F